MGKIRISPRRKTSTIKGSVSKQKEVTMLEKFEGIRKADPTTYILDPKNLGDAIADCLLNNDPEGVIEVVEIYLETLNKEKFRDKAKVGKSTYYSMLKGKNPTIKTLAKIVHSLTH